MAQSDIIFAMLKPYSLVPLNALKTKKLCLKDEMNNLGDTIACFICDFLCVARCSKLGSSKLVAKIVSVHTQSLLLLLCVHCVVHCYHLQMNDSNGML